MRILAISVVLLLIGYWLHAKGYLGGLIPIMKGGDSSSDGGKANASGCGCGGKAGCDGNHSHGSGLNQVGYHQCGPQAPSFSKGYANLASAGDPKYTAAGIVQPNGLVIQPVKQTPFFKPGTIIIQSPSIGVNSMGGFRALNSSQAQQVMPRW